MTDKDAMIAAARALVSRRMDDWIDMTVNAIADDIAAFAIEQVKAERERMRERLNRVMTDGTEPTTESWNQALATAIRFTEVENE
jgi:hypothetical protein